MHLVSYLFHRYRYTRAHRNFISVKCLIDPKQNIFWKPDSVETGHIQRYHGDPVLPVSTIYISFFLVVFLILIIIIFIF